MTVIFPSPIFGPVHSRRLGVSLGINLLPDDGKVCSFDCIYCECVSVLSNSTFIDRPAVFDALNKIDNNILKLDTVDEEYIHRLDRPNGKYSVKKIIEKMKEFKGNCIIQTMFLKGSYLGKDMDNTSDKFVLPWLEVVKEIAPRQVMIYTIDRETPDHDLQKATHEELDRIVELIKKAGIPATASY